MGGRDGSSILSSVERYDAAADAWTAVASMRSTRFSAGVAAAPGRRGPLTASELCAAGCSASEVGHARGVTAHMADTSKVLGKKGRKDMRKNKGVAAAERAGRPQAMVASFKRSIVGFFSKSVRV